MRCPNDFTCDACGKTYHRSRPKAEADIEHLKRGQTVKDYDIDTKTAEVCDPCFVKIMGELHPEIKL